MRWVSVCADRDFVSGSVPSDDLAFAALVEHSERTHGLACLRGSTLVAEGSSDWVPSLLLRAKLYPDGVIRSPGPLAHYAAELDKATPVERLRTRGNPERGDNRPIAWCSQHDMHPEDCFTIHYPESTRETDLGKRGIALWLAARGRAGNVAVSHGR
jgi:hypothetical protein